MKFFEARYCNRSHMLALVLLLIFFGNGCEASIDDLKFLYEKHNHTDGLKFYSQFDQDRYLYQKFFKEKRNGVFVDIGANDGITFSNTYFFEKTMGWTGLCVEPIPQVFEQLQRVRNAVCVQGCICSNRDTVSFLHIKGRDEMLSGILEEDSFKNAKKTENSEVITVKCYDLTQLLLAHGLTHVDYLSVDTEGSELEILKSLDFNLVDVDVIDVENNAGEEKFREFLEPLGFKKVIKLGVDIIYARDRKK